MSLFDRWKEGGGRQQARSTRAAEVHALVVEAILRNPLTAIADPGAKERLLAGDEVSFDELGLDSLARLTLAVDLNESGFDVSELDIDEAGGPDGLTRLLLRLS